MPDHSATEIKRLRDRAGEIRSLAEGMKQRAARTTMIAIATSYEQMADQIENRKS